MASPAKKSVVTAPSALALRIAQKSAPAWRPEPGETVTVRLITAKMAEGGEYDDYPVLTVQNVADESYLNVHAFHGLLQAGLAELAPAKGDMFTLHYVGYVMKNEAKKRAAADENYVSDSKTDYYHNYLVFPGDGTEDEDDSDVDFSKLTPKVK